MNSKKSSLKRQIWVYLIIFSVIILAFLWLFQVMSLGSYYKHVKKRDMSIVENQIITSYETGDYQTIFDRLSYDKSVCIELIVGNTYVYSSDAFNRECVAYNSKESLKYKNLFLNSSAKKASYQFINPRFKNETLMNALRLDEDVYVFVNTSLDPIDSTVMILKDQFIYVTLVVLILSLLLGYFISKRISKPIVKINNAAKKMANGEYDVVFHTDDNIEELNELADTLNYTRNELAKTDELRRDLMANVGHDLKTPLTMIKAYAEMVRDLTYKNKDKREENLNVIIEETDRLTLLVNDIVMLSSLQANATQLKIETFDLTHVIDSIIHRYHIFKETEHYQFIFDTDHPIYVQADKKKIEQVIYNLLNNAMNYTGDDNKVSIILEETEKEVKVSIVDTGKGIKKEDLPLIWDRYYKSDKKHKRNMVGTGLGLSIVKNIFVCHNIAYGVTSEVKKGTTFYFVMKK